MQSLMVIVMMIELKGPPLLLTPRALFLVPLSLEISYGKLLQQLCYGPVCASADGDAGAGASGSTADDSRSSATPT